MSKLDQEYIKGVINSSIDVKQKLLNSPQVIDTINKLVYKSLEALNSGGKIIFAGNGGSFGDAQHLSAEFTSRFLFDRAPLASIALGTNSSSMSAIGNDYGYENVFSRELEAVGNDNDIFIVPLMCVMCVAIPFVLVTIAPRFITAAEVNLFFLLETIIGPIWVWLIIKEQPSPETIVGGAIIVLTIATHSFLKLKKS